MVDFALDLERKQGMARAVACRLIAGGSQGEDKPHELVFGEPVGIGRRNDHRHDIGARVSPTEVCQLEAIGPHVLHRLEELLGRRRIIRIGGRRERVGPPGQCGPVFIGHAEKVADRVQWELACHLSDKVKAAKVNGPPDDLGGDGTEVRFEAADDCRCESTVDEAAIPDVGLAVHGDHGRFAAIIYHRRVGCTHGYATPREEAVGLSQHGGHVLVA